MVSEPIFPTNWGYVCIEKWSLRAKEVPDLRVRKRPFSLSAVAFSSLSDQALPGELYFCGESSLFVVSCVCSLLFFVLNTSYKGGIGH